MAILIFTFYFPLNTVQQYDYRTDNTKTLFRKNNHSNIWNRYFLIQKRQDGYIFIWNCHFWSFLLKLNLLIIARDCHICQFVIGNCQLLYFLKIFKTAQFATFLFETVKFSSFIRDYQAVHGKTTDEWHTNGIWVHTSDIRITY